VAQSPEATWRTMIAETHGSGEAHPMGKRRSPTNPRASAHRPRGAAKAKPGGSAAKHKPRASAKAELRKVRDPSGLRGDAALAEYKRGEAMERFRKQQPQLWLQAQRLGRVLEIQNQVEGQVFPPGCCFLHANLVTVSHFCVRQVREVNLDTCQVTLDIHGDDNLEAGIVVIPLETVEWFGFPTRAVPTGVHFQGFAAGEPVMKPPSEPPPAN
jgi:hypothetical protein